MEKPICVYISNLSSYVSYDWLNDSLKFICLNDFGIPFINLSFGELQDFKDSQPILFFVLNVKIEDKKEIKNILFKIRIKYKEIPVLVPWRLLDKNLKKDPRLIPFSPFSNKNSLIEIISRFIENFYFNKNYFGNLSRKGINTLNNFILDIYQKRLEEEPAGDLGTGDYNHQLISEYLRIRLFASGISNVFDKNLDGVILEDFDERFTLFNSETYERKLKEIRLMSSEERSNLFFKIMKSQGSLPDEFGIFRSTGEGFGAKNFYFVFDLKTRMFQISNGFGRHEIAEDQLRRRISNIESVKNNKFIESYEISNDFIKGLILPEIDGPIPFLQIYDDLSEEEFWLISWLREKRRFILVDFEGNLL